ncbi:MAG: DUF362 domain-containing protein [Candidatus Zhuqueibacterota bacterium]
MQPTVYFIATKNDDSTNMVQQKFMQLYRESRAHTCSESGDLAALKIHFGEEKNTTHIQPELLKPFIAELKRNGVKPFFTDTCVLYRSQRSDAVSHLLLAEKHGFSMQHTGAPVVIADGLRGRNEIDVAIPGQLFTKVSIATEAVISNAMFVFTHVTGHMASGLGGALKNLGMGLASRKGKLRQHSSVSPSIDVAKCNGCGQCLLWCPENAITMNGSVAVINRKICIGCGECLTVCHFGAVKYNWQTSSQDLQRKMTEHALGAIYNKRDKTYFFNFLTNITKDCDCMTRAQRPMMDDIGILAGSDPVAIDKASLDLIERHAGKSLVSMTYDSLDPLIQMQHGERIGLGSMTYRLVELNQ